MLQALVGVRVEAAERDKVDPRRQRAGNQARDGAQRVAQVALRKCGRGLVLCRQVANSLTRGVGACGRSRDELQDVV